jgi:hypothetical protein
LYSSSPRAIQQAARAAIVSNERFMIGSSLGLLVNPDGAVQREGEAPAEPTMIDEADWVSVRLWRVSCGSAGASPPVASLHSTRFAPVGGSDALDQIRQTFRAGPRHGDNVGMAQLLARQARRPVVGTQA